MTKKKKWIIIGVTIWILGALYLGPKAMEEARRDITDAVEGRKTFDGDESWRYLKGIVFPSTLLEDKEEK